jgi:hypothetical protein
MNLRRKRGGAHVCTGVLAALLAALLAAGGTACGDEEDTTTGATGVAAGGGGGNAPAGRGGGDAAGAGASAGGATATAFPAYVGPGDEAMAAITIDRATGSFFVDSAESGKIYRGEAGADVATTLTPFADFTSAGLTRGGHLSIAGDGQTLVIATGFGDAPRLFVVDVASAQLVRTIDLPANANGFPGGLQDVAVTADGSRAYATNSLENIVFDVDLGAGTVDSFPISAAFPFISDPAQGFLNATGIALANDASHLLVVHLIDKHIYRISLAEDSLGEATKLDTDPYNVSGNGLWLGLDDELLEVAGDELRVFRFRVDGAGTKATFEERYQGDEFEQGLSYAVAHGDRVLVLNGSGLGLGAGGPGAGGFPGGTGGFPAGGSAGAFPGGGTGFPGTPTGTKKLPIQVLQLARLACPGP